MHRKLLDLSAKTLSLVLGVLASYWLAHAMAPRLSIQFPEGPKPMLLPVKVKAVPAPAAEPKPQSEVLPAQPKAAPPAPKTDKELRLKAEKAAPKPKKPKPVEAPPTPPVETPVPIAPQASLPALSTQDLPTLSQPSLPGLAPKVEPLPQIGVTDDIPEAPPEDKTYPEKPGGNVLVLGILLDENGRVLNTRILVPSFNALTDLAVSMATLDQRYGNVEPPLAPGETRWIELRIPFKRPGEPDSLLP